MNIVIGYCKDIVMTRSSTQRGSIEPPLLIVHGGAGTGKSFLINIVTFWVQKLLSQAGDDINSPYMIRAAPTGLAATNIDGQTVHSAFRLGFGNNYQSLSDKNRDTMRDMFKNVQVVIIDEFSMLKSEQLYQLHLRLCEIKQNEKVFGGVCLLLFGDLMQLKPIKGSYIFQQPKYGQFREVHEIFPLWELFRCVNLEENHRQGEDRQYGELLNPVEIQREKGRNCRRGHAFAE